MPKLTRTLAAVAGAAATGLLAEKAAARRVRRRVDPENDARLVPPTDVRHLTVPTHDDGSLHLLERGDGRPLVLLHGITLNAELWSPQLRDLSAQFRVLALDLRGHGRSKAGTDRFGLPVLGRDLATVLIKLDLRDALVVGHSMGGMTALRFAVDHADVLADRVSGLGLVATAASLPTYPFLVPRLTALGALIVDRLDDGRPLRSMRFSGNDLSLLLCRSVFGRDPSAAAIEQVRASIEAMADEPLQRSLVGLFDHDLRNELETIRTPSFVVVGTRDILTPRPFARVLAERLPDCELHVLDQAGHQLMQERPDEVAELIRALAARTATGDATPGPQTPGASAPGVSV